MEGPFLELESSILFVLSALTEEWSGKVERNAPVYDFPWNGDGFTLAFDGCDREA